MPAKHVISCSRRTDIPAYYADWFWDKLARGGVHGRTMYGTSFYVSLKPEDVAGFVFWSKNPRPLMAGLDQLERLDLAAAFFLTITGYGRELERGTPDSHIVVEAARQLMQRYGEGHVWWRYDPIILTKTYSETWHIQNFQRLADALRGTPRVVMSFLAAGGSYAHVGKRMLPVLAAHGDGLDVPSIDRQASPVSALARIAEAMGIAPQICAQPELANAAGVPQAACMEPELLRQVFPLACRLPAKPTRLGCNCVETRDIGAMDTCPNGCIYCSTNRNCRGFGPIPPSHPWLWPEPLSVPPAR